MSISLESISSRDVERERIKDIGEQVDSAGAVAEQVSQEELAARIRRLGQAFPGYIEGGEEYLRTARDWMGGKMSGSAIKRLKEHAQVQALNLGFRPGTEFTGFGEVENYGRALAELQQQGMAAYTQFGTQIAQPLAGDPFSMSAMFMSTDKHLDAAVGQADRAVEVASWNAALQQQKDTAAADEARMNRISAESRRSQGIAQRNAMVASIPSSSGSGNPFAPGGDLYGRSNLRSVARRNNYSSFGTGGMYNYGTAQRQPFMASRGATNISAPMGNTSDARRAATRTFLDKNPDYESPFSSSFQDRLISRRFGS